MINYKKQRLSYIWDEPENPESYPCPKCLYPQISPENQLAIAIKPWIWIDERLIKCANCELNYEAFPNSFSNL